MTYNVDTGKSVINWEGRKRIGKVEHGEVKLAAGSFKVEGGRLAGGSFTADMNTIDGQDSETGQSIDKLNKHLKSDEFFGVEQYPTAELKIKQVEGDIVTADLSIRNKMKEVSFPVRITEEGNTARVETEFSFDRSSFDVKYGSGKFYQNLGDALIEDEVLLKVLIVGQVA